MKRTLRLLLLTAATAVMAAQAPAALVTYYFTGTRIYQEGPTSTGDTISGAVTLDSSAAVDHILDFSPYGYIGEGAYWIDGAFAINAITDTGYTIGTSDGDGSTTFYNIDLLSYQPPARPYYLGSAIYWAGDSGANYRQIEIFALDTNTAGNGIAEFPEPWTPWSNPSRAITIYNTDIYTGEESYNIYSLDSFEVGPTDATPPTFTSLTPSTATLRPPNHEMVPITLAAVTSDNVGVVSTKIISATSSEADDGLGDGDTANDIEITGDLSLSLRAERSGRGSGRTYTITVQAADLAGNKTRKTTAVSVPKSRSKK